jgi:hypothetical protein
LSGFVRSGSEEVEVVETMEARLANVGTSELIFDMTMLFLPLS